MTGSAGGVGRPTRSHGPVVSPGPTVTAGCVGRSACQKASVAGTVRTGDTRPQLFVESPDDRAFGPGSLHGESRDLLGRSSLVETGGERIAAEPQQLMRREGLTVLAVSGQPHECKGSVLGRQSPERALSGGERSGAPEELQPAELPLAERDRQL